VRYVIQKPQQGNPTLGSAVYAGTCAASYSFGFNGMEKDDEVCGATGTSYDFGARLYGSREGRWLSLDPKASKYPNMSPYAAFGLNPLYYIDPGGETLRVASARAEDLETARGDIYSLLPSGPAGEKYRTLLDFADDGTVIFNISEEMLSGNTDAGVALLAGLVGSQKQYLYEVSGMAHSRKREGGERVQDLEFGAENYQVENLSNTRMSFVEGAPGSAQDNRFNSDLPSDPNVDGHVYVSPTTTRIKESRASIVFHEMEENYQRTENGLPYSSAYDDVPKGAHNIANEKGLNFKAGDSRKAPPDGKFTYEKP
jgi:RHS repeat-associated protein